MTWAEIAEQARVYAERCRTAEAYDWLRAGERLLPHLGLRDADEIRAYLAGVAAVHAQIAP